MPNPRIRIKWIIRTIGTVLIRRRSIEVKSLERIYSMYSYGFVSSIKEYSALYIEKFLQHM